MNSTPASGIPFIPMGIISDNSLQFMVNLGVALTGTGTRLPLLSTQHLSDYAKRYKPFDQIARCWVKVATVLGKRHVTTSSYTHISLTLHSSSMYVPTEQTLRWVSLIYWQDSPSRSHPTTWGVGASIYPMDEPRDRLILYNQIKSNICHMLRKKLV